MKQNQAEINNSSGIRFCTGYIGYTHGQGLHMHEPFFNQPLHALTVRLACGVLGTPAMFVLSLRNDALELKAEIP